MQKSLVGLRTIDWLRNNEKLWMNRAIKANGKINRNEQGIFLTYIQIKNYFLSLLLTVNLKRRGLLLDKGLPEDIYMGNVVNKNDGLDPAQKVATFKVKQKMPYEFKVNYARIRAWEFYNECAARNLDCYVSVGGLDSITLFYFLKSIGINVPAVSVSSLEDISIQKIHKKMGVISLKPAKREDGTYWMKPQVLQEFGFPVLSKEIAKKIELLQNQSPQSKTVRHAIVTGETGAYGGYKRTQE